MKRKPLTSLKRIHQFALLSILGIDLLSLYVHNKILPWLFLIMLAGYYILHCEIKKKNRIDYFSGIISILFPEKTSSIYYLHWFLFAYAPLLFSLYYLDFKLLFTGFFLNSIAVVLIYQENSK